MLPHPLNEKGPLLQYIEKLKDLGMVREAKETILGVRECLSTPGGRILMELLEKTTIQSSTGILEDSRALAARNAQSFIAHDLRRVMSNESDAILRMEITGYVER